MVRGGGDPGPAVANDRTPAHGRGDRLGPPRYYVLSSTATGANWPITRFLRGLEDVAALKQEPGRNLYLIGGAWTTASLIKAGLVDELRLLL